jgi:hypothetical protein
MEGFAKLLLGQKSFDPKIFLIERSGLGVASCLKGNPFCGQEKTTDDEKETDTDYGPKKPGHSAPRFQVGFAVFRNY